MIKRRFVRRSCGHSFAIEVFEKGEAEEKKKPSWPVRCEKCSGPVVQE